MSARYGVMAIVGSLAVLSATSASAESPPHQTFSGAQNAAYMCAAAAASAQIRNTATDHDLAACTMAVRLNGENGIRVAAALTNLGVMHLARGEYDAAIADSDAALSLDGKLGEAMVNRGVALQMLGRSKEAAADLTRALDLNPAHMEVVYFNRAMALEDTGDLHGAYLDYRKAAELVPSWDRPRKELARFTVVRSTPTS